MPETKRAKGLALLVLAIAQLMVVLDATIVNVALAYIRDDLGFRTDADLQWIVTAYTLTFGGFLLLGGKLGDRIGRRAVFIAGTIAFAVASLLGGLATSEGLLVAARGLQGLGAALMSPAALSLLTVVFPEGEQRNKALGIWAGITAGGAALGLVLGGLLTQYMPALISDNGSWRWVLFVNLPIAVASVLGALRYVPESRDENARGFDVPGAVLVTGGLMALVFGLVKGNEVGWGSRQTVLTFVVAAVLLVAFVAVQQQADSPLVPFRLFASRSLTGADSAALLVGAGIFANFFFLVLWMQVINGWSPLKAGVAFLVFPFSIGISATLASKLLARVGPRALIVPGLVLAALGSLLYGMRLEADSGYWSVLVPSMVITAFGMGLAFVALTSAAVAGVPHEDAGIASALLNAGQQVGGALGLAILTAVTTSRLATLNAENPPQGPQDPVIAQNVVESWTAGFYVSAAFLAAAAVVAGALIRVDKAEAAAALKEGAAVAH